MTEQNDEGEIDIIAERDEGIEIINDAELPLKIRMSCSSEMYSVDIVGFHGVQETLIQTDCFRTAWDIYVRRINQDDIEEADGDN